MVSLKASRFRVENDDNAPEGYRVYTRVSGEFKEVTNKLTDEDKNVLEIMNG